MGYLEDIVQLKQECLKKVGKTECQLEETLLKKNLISLEVFEKAIKNPHKAYAPYTDDCWFCNQAVAYGQITSKEDEDRRRQTKTDKETTECAYKKLHKLTS